MNKEIRDRWVAALRSGEYKQGNGYLHDTWGNEDRFCCLGVLCDIAAREGVVEVSRLGRGVLYGGSKCVLPPSVQIWSGVGTDCGVLPDNSGVLTELNDNGMPFAEIAEVIEEMF